MTFLLKKYQEQNKSNYLDLIEPNQDEFKERHYQKTFDLWGKGNNAKNKLKFDGNDTHIEKIIETFGKEDFMINGDSYLEIGCGEGIDLNYFTKNFNFKNIYTVDIGANIKDLSKREDFKNVHFSRCDCLNLPFENDSFDLIYSYGVFHHTKDFDKALSEAKRVLKENGVMFFYTYKKQKNLIKRMGVFIENILLKVFSNLSYNKTKILCYLLSPIVLILFSYPAQLFKFAGFKKIYKKFPFWWGVSPKNIIYDLTDRLYAPINIRYDTNELKKELEKLNFSKAALVDVNDGIFCRIVK
tara:strand:- start:5115 stop:6011 length:897 start_codon:yes stop_codon:yes gene_type:complete